MLGGGASERADNTTQTVYFDAFKHDYLDDPLIALTGEVAKRFTTDEDLANAEKSEQKAVRVQKLKKSAWAVGKGITRVGLSLATFGATEALGDMGDEIAQAIGDEAKAFVSSAGGEEEARKFWAMHEAKTAAIDGFRLALEELTEPTEDGTPTRKLVIVIDELDRCRPDYALQLLEIIKHFFNVPGVHFVLGVNLKELQNSVRARYGAGVDAERYLRKFISAYFLLRTANSHKGRNDVAAAHLRQSLDVLGLAEEKGVQGALQHFLLASNSTQITLRDAEHIASTVALAYRAGSWDNHTYVICVAAACIIKTLSRDLFGKILNGKSSFEEIALFLGLPEEISDATDKFDRITWNAIALCTGKIDPSSTSHDDFPQGEFESNQAGEVLTRIARGHLGTFSLDL